MPTPTPLTSERFERHGLYLLEDAQTLFLFVGRDAVPQLIIDVFDLPSYDSLRGGKVNTKANFLGLMALANRYGMHRRRYRCSIIHSRSA
jgi:hypothetical protein